MNPEPVAIGCIYNMHLVARGELGVYLYKHVLFSRGS